LKKTEDHGLTWNELPNDYGDNCIDVSIFSEDSIISVHGNQIKFTTDGGNSYESNQLPEYSRGINFLDFNIGYIIGYNNRILSTNNKGLNWNYLTESNGAGSADTWGKNIEFVADNLGFACGWNGFFKKTTDQGDSWTKINTGLTGHITDVSFVNENTGYVIGGNSGYTYLAKSTDAGLSFNIVSSFNSYLGNKIEFVNQSTGFLSGYYSFYRTTNAGVNWNYIDLHIQIYGIDFLNDNTGYVCGGMLYSSLKKIYKTTNSGLNWVHLYSTTDDLYKIDFTDNNTGYISGRGVYKTTNAGENWIKLQSLTSNPFLSGINFLNSQTGYVSGYGEIYRTTNGGIQWQINEIVPTNERLEDIIFFNINTGIIVGDKGTILKTYNGGGNFITGVLNSTTVNSEINFILNQNYPNPFNPVTNLEFTCPPARQGISELGLVTLKIYDLLGKEVASIVNEKLNPGSYRYQFDGSNLSSGVYYYTLRAGDFVETRRMVLLK